MSRTCNLFLIGLLFFISCTSKNGKDRQSTREEPELMKRWRTEWDDLVGEWNVSAIDSMGSSERCNACPRIVFLTDATAEVHRPDGQLQSLIWEVRDHKLTVENVNTSHPLFENGQYHISIITEEKFTEIRLTPVGKTVEFVLRRATNP